MVESDEDPRHVVSFASHEDSGSIPIETPIRTPIRAKRTNRREKEMIFMVIGQPVVDEGFSFLFCVEYCNAQCKEVRRSVQVQRTYIAESE